MLVPLTTTAAGLALSTECKCVLLSWDEATLVRRLAESDPTAQFARDPDTVDRLPTFECAVFDGGQPVATAVCRVLEPVVTERLLPYLRKRFDCATLELSHDHLQAARAGARQPSSGLDNLGNPDRPKTAQEPPKTWSHSEKKGRHR